MNSKSQVFSAILITVITMIFVVAIGIGTLGKTKVNYVAEVQVKNGSLENDFGQSIYLKSPGSECTFEITAEGTKELESDFMVYKDSSKMDSYLLITATEDAKTSEAMAIEGDMILLKVSRRIAQNATIQDGTYNIAYTITVRSTGGAGGVMVMIVIAVAAVILSILALTYEGNKEVTCTKRRIRMRGRAYTNGFLVMSMVLVAMSLMSGFIEHFPFTMFQAGLISFLIGATVFIVSANRNKGFTGIRRSRGILVVLFAIIAGVNLFAVLLDLVIKKSASSASVATGTLGNWVINALAAVCFFIMMLDLLTQNAKETEAESRRRREE